MRDPGELKGYYERELLPQLKELNARRHKVAAAVIAIDLVGFGLMASPLLLLALASLINPDYNLGCCCFGMVFFIAGVAFIGFGNKKATEGYVRDYKNNVVGKMVKFIDQGLEFSKEGGIGLDRYRESGIFLTHVDRYHCEDRIWGAVGKTSLEFSEVHSEYKTETRDSKGHRHTQWHTIFRGIFFVADFNKQFKGFTVVLPDTAQKLFGDLIGGFLQSKSIGRPDLVKLEDPEFEKLFVVYGNDQVEARYILSPSLMQRMVEFKKKTGKSVHFGFNKSNIYVAVPYPEDLFEPHIFRSIVDYDQVKRYYDAVALVTGIVEDLSLNTRIWGKE
jgi:hypothetical protein